jgi:hypothetical protein
MPRFCALAATAETLLGFDCAKHLRVKSFSVRSHDAVIRAYHYAGNVLETHKQAAASSGDFWFHR